MNHLEKNLMILGRAILVWLIKGACIGAGAWLFWRVCHAS